MRRRSCRLPSARSRRSGWTKRRRGEASAIEHRDGLTRFDVHRDGDTVRTIRVAAARRAQRAQRAGGDRGRHSRRHHAADARRRAAAVQGHQAPARDRRRGAAASRCSTTSRTIRRRCTKRWPRCAPAIPGAGSGRCSSRARPRRAAASFRTISPRRSAPPTKWSLLPCFDRSLPEAERLSAEQLVDDLRSPGPPCPAHSRGRRHRRDDRRASTATATSSC